MLLPYVLHHLVATRKNLLRATEMHVGGREKRKAAVVMVVVVPGHEFGHEDARSLDRREELGKVRSIFERFEVRFGERIVVGTCGREWLLVMPRSAKSSASDLDFIAEPPSA